VPAAIVRGDGGFRCVMQPVPIAARDTARSYCTVAETQFRSVPCAARAFFLAFGLAV
jgi:hypothetical protein